jgi:hypothetical protein
MLSQQSESLRLLWSTSVGYRSLSYSNKQRAVYQAQWHALRAACQLRKRALESCMAGSHSLLCGLLRLTAVLSRRWLE